ncbi:hypothetical protein R50073_49650 (plasmid) [Maricurvus nonylphenolicus]|uniref:hypothetical protein n=1 Tax=Maricurvus nonylphenolicus TaxID=1008307 RepID=UPI0036F26B8D
MTTSVNFEELAQAILAENRQRHADRMKELYKTTLPFEEDFFNRVLAEMSDAAFQGTGLSYELYVNKLSSAVTSLSLGHPQWGVILSIFFVHSESSGFPII